MINQLFLASAAAAEEGEQGGLEETSADISGIDDEHAEAADIVSQHENNLNNSRKLIYYYTLICASILYLINYMN